MNELDKAVMKKVALFLAVKLIGYAAIRLIMRSVSRG